MALPSPFLSRAREPAVFASLLALFLLLITRNVSPEPYVYDEADYMYAASLGFAANWSDTPSMAIVDFVRAGIHRDHDGRKGLSDRIRSGNDVLFYRHFHGPLFYYLLVPASSFGLSEHLVRTAMLAIPCASLAVVYFGCLSLVAGSSASLTALLTAMLFLSSFSVIWSTEVAPHQLFALCSLLSLILLLNAARTGDRRYWYGSIVAAGLAFCTLEIAIVLLVILGICCFVERNRLRADRKLAAKSLALFLATVLVIWPAAFLRLSFAKSYAVMTYLAVSRASPWGNVSFLETWSSRVLASPLEWILILVGGILLLRTRRLRLYPIGLFGAVMLVATLRVLTKTPRYSLAFVPVLDLLAGLALVPSLGPLRRPASLAVVSLAVAGLYGSACYQVAHRSHNSNPRSAAVLTYIHQNELENKRVLAPQADIPTLHLYFPSMKIRGYFGSTPTVSDVASFEADAIMPATKP